MRGLESLLAGRTLAGRYHIDAVIGRGGMGAVYRATDRRLERTVAVKVISQPAGDAAQQEKSRARFQREARAAARLQHPNVVAVHDYDTDRELDLDFLVMELLHGEDLLGYVQRTGPLQAPMALDVLRQAAEGIAAGHRAGLVHRDVKPSNLFLERAETGGALRVRVLDFGIAQVLASEETSTQLTQFGHTPYSPGYASPEQLRGMGSLTCASDVFSLGLVGHFLLTGERALTDEDARVLAQGGHVRIPRVSARRPDVPPALDAALAAATEISARNRPADAHAFLQVLGGAAPSVLVAAPAYAAAPSRPKLSKIPRRQPEPRSTLPAVAAVVTVIAALLYFLILREQSLPQGDRVPLAAAEVVETPSTAFVSTGAAAERSREPDRPAAARERARRAESPARLAGRQAEPPRTSAPRTVPAVVAPSAAAAEIRSHDEPPPSLPEAPPRSRAELEANPGYTPYDQKPELLNRSSFGRLLEQKYPRELRRAGIGGTVVVHVFIDETGTVTSTRIQMSSGYPEIDTAAQEVLREAVFSPAWNRGERVPVWIALPVTFKSL